MENNWRENEDNFVLDKGDWYVSYNPSIKDNQWDKLLGVLAPIYEGKEIIPRTGKDETAFIKRGSITFYVLNGDFRKELEVCSSFEEALEVFKKNIKHKSSFSMDELTNL
jgi:hypothetical protein